MAYGTYINQWTSSPLLMRQTKPTKEFWEV
jgi:hypothetical protein